MYVWQKVLHTLNRYKDFVELRKLCKEAQLSTTSVRIVLHCMEKYDVVEHRQGKTKHTFEWAITDIGRQVLDHQIAIWEVFD